MIAAVADGVGGARGGRVAAETAVRGLIDGMLGQSEALPVHRRGGVAIEAMNSWIHATGRADPELAGMACTLTALVLRGRRRTCCMSATPGCTGCATTSSSS